MRTELLYQRWLELDIPPACGGDRAVPVWVWPVALSDGRGIVTFLYRPLGEKPSGPQTLIAEISPVGDADLWKPGQGYPAPIIFYANDRDDLVGMDLVKSGKVYACRPDGEHLWTLATTLKMDNLIAPRLFEQQGDCITWQSADGKVQQGRVDAGGVTGIVSLPDAPESRRREVRFPHTHVTGDGTLWIFDFDPMPRITRYKVMS
jgi:hypothetical protein